MPKTLLLYFLSLCLIVCASVARGQTVKQDSSFVRQAVAELAQVYQDSIGLQSHLYSGAEYTSLAKHYMEGHPYFKTKSFEPGSVHYDGVELHDVRLMYDVEQDELAIIYPGTGYIIKLVKQLVTGFELGGETFQKLALDSTASPSKATYYSVLHDGQVKVLAQRRKVGQERVTSKGFEGEYRVEDRHYLIKDGAYHPISRKRSLLALMQDERKDLNAFIRENKLKFRKQHKEASFVKVARHYDSLKR